MIPFFEKKSQNIYGSLTGMEYFPPHIHTHIEIVFVRKGMGRININSHVYELFEGDLALIFPNSIHSYEENHNICEAVMLICGVELLGEFFNQMMNFTPVSPVIRAKNIHKDVSYAVNSLLDECLTPHKNIAPKKAVLELILSRTLPIITLEKNSTVLQNNTTSKIINFICENYKNELSLDILSRKFGVHKSYISRIFSKKIGVSFTDYVNDLRVDRAKRMLLETDILINEIAFECGFETQRSFNRVFKKNCNMTPVQYRLRS